MLNELDRLIAMLDTIGRVGRYPHSIALDALVDQCNADFDLGDDSTRAVQVLLAATMLRQAARQPDDDARRDEIAAAFTAARSALDG